MLGYPGGDDVFLKLEQMLEYPYHIGHRSKKDLPSGRTDYRAGLKGRRGSFIVEAKAGNAIISQSDVEQAHSYAAHAKVGANYFVLCDGSKIVVYETLSGSECSPLVELPIREIDGKFHELENLLSPTYLARHCQVKYDLHLKLCDGLGSSVNIQSGEYGMDYWAYRVLVNGADCTTQLKSKAPQFTDLDKQLEMMASVFVLNVSDGFTARDADGKMYAQVSFSGVTKNSMAAMKLLGIEKMTFSSDEKFLSTDKSKPTVFESTADFSLVRGTMIPQLFGGAIPVDANVDGDVFVSALIHKDGDQLNGEYVALAVYHFGSVNVKIELDFLGKFGLRLIT